MTAKETGHRGPRVLSLCERTDYCAWLHSEISSSQCQCFFNFFARMSMSFRHYFQERICKMRLTLCKENSLQPVQRLSLLIATLCAISPCRTKKTSRPHEKRTDALYAAYSDTPSGLRMRTLIAKYVTFISMNHASNRITPSPYIWRRAESGCLIPPSFPATAMDPLVIRRILACQCRQFRNARHHYQRRLLR